MLNTIFTYKERFLLHQDLIVEYNIVIAIYIIIIPMKKLIDSDCLRAVQFKCNTSANYTL